MYGAVMGQNIYDDARFFDAYASLPRSRGGLAAAPEWPAVQQMLPDLSGLRVLDLGCGYGWFARYAVDQGADLVVGLDASERMLEVARTSTASNTESSSESSSESSKNEPLLSYRQADLDTFEPSVVADVTATGSFDLVYSSLALHYVADFNRLMRTISHVVTADAVLVATIEHPVATAPSQPTLIAGHEGRWVWPLDDYFDEGPRVTNWLGSEVVKQHRTLESYMRALREGGFVVTDLREWHPSTTEIDEHPTWVEFTDHPSFLLFRADRRSLLTS